jgi:hypothetical protein
VDVDLARLAIAVLIVNGLLDIANKSLDMAHRLFEGSRRRTSRKKGSRTAHRIWKRPPSR